MRWLKQKKMRDVHDLDSLSTTVLHGKIIRRKAFLRRVYLDFYEMLRDAVPGDAEGKRLVEIGSGGGFIKEVIPSVTTSDVINLPEVDMAFSALQMPFEDESVDAFFMIDVLHHLRDSRHFLKEAQRCLKTGGVMAMVEPANTLWGRFVWTHLHHEPFDTSGGWGLQEGGRLSSANGAIPWIIFFRDREVFDKEFPNLEVVRLDCHTPLRYILSGGVSMKQLLPSFTYGAVRLVENCLAPFNKYLGIFMTIVLKKL